jgi:hypothetical protein
MRSMTRPRRSSQTIGKTASTARQARMDTRAGTAGALLSGHRRADISDVARVEWPARADSEAAVIRRASREKPPRVCRREYEANVWLIFLLVL